MEMKEGTWEAELEQIVTQYTDMLFRISYSMCGIAADAEDILQNVFLKLCVKRPHFRDDAHCRAWLIRVTINETKNALRFRAVRREEDIAPLITGFDIFTKGDSGSVAVYLENPDAAVLEPVHDAQSLSVVGGEGVEWYLDPAQAGEKFTDAIEVDVCFENGRTLSGRIKIEWADGSFRAHFETDG